MPSSLHPQAKFDPFPPDLDLGALVEKTSNFDYVIRISVDQITNAAEFEHLVLIHVIIGGRPLVIEGWNNKLPPWLFSPNWLQENVRKKEEHVRDISNCTNIPMTIGHYLNSMDKLTRQWTPTNFREAKRQRLYLKDIDCPEAWYQHLQGFIPQTLFYLNDCVAEKGGPGAVQERNMYNQLVLGKGIGPAGDLMSNLPEEMRAQNMMCYIGHEGTYTPAHREMCASLGQNIMLETSTTANGEKPGSSIWFMTESKDREVVSEYFLSMLGHDIEVESHFAQINAWKKAPFPVYIVEQKVGDFILIPPLAPHQVWNRGTRTMKAAWNRTTVETLELAIHEALPRARMVCRDEQYKNKAIIYYSLLRYHDQLRRAELEEEGCFQGYSTEPIRNAFRVKQLKRDFKRLFALYTEIVVSEMFSPDLPKEKDVEFIPFDSNITCAYCRCNIFNRFLTCKTCIGKIEGSGEEDTYDICMECFAMGRSCACISNLKWVEQWHWPVLTQRYEQWRAMVISNDGYVDIHSSPQALEIARTRCGRKPVAQVCQEQLKLRPWRDPAKNDGKELSPRFMDFDSEPEVDDEGRVIKKKSAKRRQVQQQKNCRTCHICQHQDWNWKLAFCTTCTNAYCYGSLWRAFDLKPQTIMEMADWKCPKCQKTCSCGKCRKDPAQTPYRPKGTLLGHDTRKVADPRSVESLVDFRRTNLTWLRGEGDDDPHSSQRMQKLVQKAQEQKTRDEILEEALVVPRNVTSKDFQSEEQMGHLAIDPLLRGSDHFSSAEDPTTTGSDAGSMFLRGYTNPGEGHFNLASHAENNVMLGGYAPPFATMVGSDSVYPDPSGQGHDRMMGMGYYQQANDVDKILFDDPNSHTPMLVNPSSTNPRIPDDSNHHDVGSEKRKLDNLMSMNSTQDEAHIQYAHAVKKQKLAQAKRDDTYFITKNRHEGGGQLTAKLPMQGSKEFLRHLEKLDSGIDAENTRQNPRPFRPHIRRRSEVDEDTVMVTSDLQRKKTSESMCREIGDEDDGDEASIFVSEAAAKAIRKPVVGQNPDPGTKVSVDTGKSERSAKDHHLAEASDDTMDVDIYPSVKKPSLAISKSRVFEGSVGFEGSEVLEEVGRSIPKTHFYEGPVVTDASEAPKKRGCAPRFRGTDSHLQLDESEDLKKSERPPKSRAFESDVQLDASEAPQERGRPPKSLRPSGLIDTQDSSTAELNGPTKSLAFGTQMGATSEGRKSAPQPTFGVALKVIDDQKLKYGVGKEPGASQKPTTEQSSSSTPPSNLSRYGSSEKPDSAKKLSYPPAGHPEHISSAQASPSNTTDQSTCPVPSKPKYSRRIIFAESTSNHGDSDESESEVGGLVDENYNPIPSFIDKDYARAKLDALKDIEAEMATTNYAKNAKNAKYQIERPIQRSFPVITGPLGSVIPGSSARYPPGKHYPPGTPYPPGKILPLADRRALQGKTTKIVHKTPSLNQGPTVAKKPSTSQLVVRRPSVAYSRERSYSADSSSDNSDGKESIPAVRPKALNQQIKPAGMLERLRKGTLRSSSKKM